MHARCRTIRCTAVQQKEFTVDGPLRGRNGAGPERAVVGSVADVIKVGATSWAEKSLLSAGWYPSWARDAASRLRFYASRFDLVENDSAYYALFEPARAEQWVERTPFGFTMNVKAYAPLTGHYTDPQRLPPDLREQLPREVAEKPRVYPEDLGSDLLQEITVRFRRSLAPLHRAGKLGAVLFQFPPWFVPSPKSRAWLPKIRALFPDYGLAVELRNPSWIAGTKREMTLSMLADNDLAFVAVDAPRGARNAMPPIAEVTSALAMVRFHGRDPARWERTSGSARDRFRYDYSLAELEEWVPALNRLAAESEETHVLFNNCYRDRAVTNARQMRVLLGQVPPE